MYPDFFIRQTYFYAGYDENGVSETDIHQVLHFATRWSYIYIFSLTDDILVGIDQYYYRYHLYKKLFPLEGSRPSPKYGDAYTMQYLALDITVSLLHVERQGEYIQRLYNGNNYIKIFILNENTFRRSRC